MGNWLSSKPNYTERTVKLPDDTELLYNDSGPVTRSNDYTTVVVLHGAGFTADGFTPLFDHAHKNNFRIINLNRRHYRGSTPYTDEELDDLKTGRKIFYDRLAMQIAWFLEHLINVEQVPKPNEERTSGGLVLVGWSFGAATALTVLSDPEVIPKSVYETIEPYFLNLVLYGVYSLTPNPI
jgi:pimeloyl-ACP methyl ester carboxylesterase